MDAPLKGIYSAPSSNRFSICWWWTKDRLLRKMKWNETRPERTCLIECHRCDCNCLHLNIWVKADKCVGKRESWGKKWKESSAMVWNALHCNRPLIWRVRSRLTSSLLIVVDSSSLPFSLGATNVWSKRLAMPIWHDSMKVKSSSTSSILFSSDCRNSMADMSEDKTPMMDLMRREWIQTGLAVKRTVR